jgi:hypothetical protein
MRIHHARLVATVIVLACVAPACASGATEEESGNGDLATVEPIEGRDVARVTLSPEAAERIDIQTSVVEPATGGRVRMTIPYSAVLYDPAGKTWTYTSPDPLVFVRAPIIVTRIDGDRALLSDGPRPGTEVVTVGAAELLGTEYEVGEE